MGKLQEGNARQKMQFKLEKKLLALQLLMMSNIHVHMHILG